MDPTHYVLFLSDVKKKDPSHHTYSILRALAGRKGFRALQLLRETWIQNTCGEPLRLDDDDASVPPLDHGFFLQLRRSGIRSLPFVWSFIMSS